MSFIETRGMLTRLLATENLVIEHDAYSHTASFNTENRVLKLPVLKTEDENVYNMFCAHEVGHALQTPQYWRNDIPDGVPFDFVNVVEDVRIEKYIQQKFPGLRKDFSVGYDQLNRKDFFKIRGQDTSKLSFIDRVNLHFKLGARAMIQFSEEEGVYVKAVDEADTWDKVVLVSKMIHDYIGSLTPDEQQQEQIEENESESSEKTSQTNSSDENQVDNSSDSSSPSSSPPDELQSETQRSFDESLENMIEDNPYTNEFVYVKPGKVNLQNIVTPIQKVRDTSTIRVEEGSKFFYDREYSEMTDFIKSTKSDVNHMVQQFEMKKSADAYARQQIHKTGVLNTNQLHNYKLTDDLFLRQSVTPDGKSHGMVMLLDWSGSMSEIAHETIKQIITLVQFCRKIQIPYEVYLFTSGKTYYDSEDLSLDRTIAHGSVRIVQVLTSTAKKQELEKDMFHLWCAGKICQRTRFEKYLPFSPWLNMGGTPLDNALIIVPDIIKEFRTRTKSQKVSFVCITDGESAPIHYHESRTDRSGSSYVGTTYPYYQKVMIRTKTGVFPIDQRPMGTACVVNWLKTQLTDVSICNIYLGKFAKSKSHLDTYQEQLDEKKFRKTGSYVTQTKFWPIIGVVNPTTFGDSTNEIEVDEGASKSQIKSALNKMLKTKQSSRIILTQLVGDFA